VKRSTEFYRDVFGLTVTMQNDKSSALMFANTGLILRHGEKPGVTHFMFGINNYDADALAATLKAHSLDPRKDQDSFHVKDPDGLDVQVGDKDMRGTSQAPEGQRHLTPKATSK
jgi:catechol 2,3-dioxygenase-like lactoylglutathione lyase family enzyme